ncbi:hypothetical protein FPANT_6019 [Fusarium pseudoanthophilum]|uniref:NACHT domain-containing protein n=1 Tax=Fusarium pseudoanthophilum TaxID=48495 RepID=A0A8H5P6I0_9HYPO|nr:hypothetical protein FPANT_6019 [Fusarium pseudoanthophilum]
MATGFEALGAASAVVQLIAFARSLVSLSFKIYDGIPTPENELEEYSTKMMEAAHRVQSRGSQMPQGTQGTQFGDKLSKVSQECINAATELRKEALTLTKRRRKGKMLKAFHSALRTERHKTKLNQLNESLNKCKELMETELLLKLCDQDTAIAQQQSQGFRSLEVDVQNIILKIAEGYVRVEQLVSTEAQATRDAINTHVTSEFKALGTKNISDNQRQRLLKSLKTEDIRERDNSVLPSSDACFERVFASYERVCRKDPGYKAWKGYKHTFGYESEEDDSEEDSDDHSNNHSYRDSCRARAKEIVDEIDLIWRCFSTWLQSDDKLFWIRGKPGAGKSTLIKFVINNDNTKRLLGSWHPNTRILSHFFWKIGSEPQNSIRGLLCSLLYDLLLEDDDAIDQVLREFKCSESKDFYKEWSSQEAEKVLRYLLDASARPTCIFVDGLDEISDKDGYKALLGVVQRLTRCQGVKVCVSSRPETELVRRLENMKVKNLRLDDLTKPEMAVFLQKEFEKLPEELSAVLPLKQFKENLLEKAQGVFLWLYLATKSVMLGIMNGDDHEILSKRLDELPEELESLYQKMWERLNGDNRVYRQTAARYFRFVIADGWGTELWTKQEEYIYEMSGPNLVQLSLAVKAEDGIIFPPKANEIKLSELDTLCTATEIDIQIRCAGMLQVGQQSDLEDDFADAVEPLIRPVRFIHRTAHDFLVDTEHGQSILNHRSNEPTLVGEHLKLLKCWLNLANTYYRELEIVSDSRDAIGHCNQLNRKGLNPEAILAILRTVKDLYEDGVLRRGSLAENNTPFPCVMAYYLESFDDFIISSFMPTPSQELATKSLHELALASRYLSMSKTSARIIRGMIELGGDAHVAKRSELPFEFARREMFTVQHITAFESFLWGALNCLEYHTSRDSFEVIDILVQTCPDLHRKVMVFLGCRSLMMFGRLPTWDKWVVVEVDLQFLINRLLANADSENIPTRSNHRIRGLAASFTRPYARVRHIVRHRREGLRTRCYRILNQEPYLDIINSLGNRGQFREAIEDHVDVLDAMDHPIDSFIHAESSFPSDCVEEVPFEEEMDILVQEGIGLYREMDVNVP